MKIQIEPHTLERAKERGASEDEIQDTIQTGFDIPAKGNRKGKAKIYVFRQERLGKYYEQKRIEIIYVEERDLIITVTVYVFYGEWKA
jgi:hypothetical protein